MTTTTKKTTRRSHDEWESLVRQWQQSGLSCVAFCKLNNIGYASFCQWRQRFEKSEAPTEKTSIHAVPAFIDLASLNPTTKTHSSWHITLNLGDGISLTLNQS